LLVDESEWEALRGGKLVSVAAPIVKLHKNDKSFAISTNAATEIEFMAAIADQMDVEGPLSANLSFLAAVVDICCKLRGYKSNVIEHRVLVAGDWTPADVVETFAVR
jgi:hypothetical protein